jgi:hypothetical protein
LSSSRYFELVLYSEQGKSGHVAARPSQCLDIARADGVGDQSENDRYGAGGLLRRHHGVVAAGQNDVRPKCDQLRRVFASTLGIAAAPTLVNPHIATLDPAQLLQALHERSQTGLSFRTFGHAHEHPDAPHPLARLRARCKRPRRRCPET